jgi:Ca-activated chloride channel family protein
MRLMLLLFLVAFQSVAQEPIRVNVGLVSLSFGVRDARGVPVTNLGAADFDVFEDGVPQKISFFARSADLPLQLGLIADFSGSQEHFVKQHHKDLQEFLEEVLNPRDRAFLVCFGNHIRLVSDPSVSPESLVNALRDFEKGGRNLPELGPKESRDLGTAFYDAVYYSVQKLAGASHERRALIVFSDGEDNASSHHMLDAIEAAQNSDTVLYCIRYTETEHGHQTARNKYGTSVMARIAHETGGADFDARKEDLSESFRRIGEELRSSYELAYQSTDPIADGSFRKVSIRPKRRELTIRAKTGYYAR